MGAVDLVTELATGLDAVVLPGMFVTVLGPISVEIEAGSPDVEAIEEGDDPELGIETMLGETTADVGSGSRAVLDPS